ncbi:hypothetical protein [Gilliamella sp. B2838]|uniref:hypothetical protein n=1 Tax=Gilliamella sp. B2838 TaxID=2818020 RepID=UPI00226A3447|nr:hypothetical protein [Gilliamella sp. B2838]MCX8727905.1 hypothetical protein [Gilliamella sp. B2838]
MDYIVNYSMVKSEHVFQQIDHDLFIDLIRNQTVSQLEQYFNSLDKEHEDASN